MRAYPLHADQTADGIEFLPDGRLVAAYIRHSKDGTVGEDTRPDSHYDLYDVREGTRIKATPYRPLFGLEDLMACDTAHEDEFPSYTLEFGHGKDNSWRWQVTPTGFRTLASPAVLSQGKCVRTPFGYVVSLSCEGAELRYLRGVVDRYGPGVVRLEEIAVPDAPRQLVFGADPDTFVAAWAEYGFSERVSAIFHGGVHHHIRRPDGSLLRRWPFAIATGPAQTIVLARQKADRPANEVLFVENTKGSVFKILNIGPVAAVALSPDRLTAAFAQCGQISLLDLDW